MSHIKQNYTITEMYISYKLYCLNYHMIIRCFIVEISGNVWSPLRCWLQWRGHLHDLLTSDLQALRRVGGWMEGNLGFLRPVRITQAFLSAQESGSAADTSLTLSVSLTRRVSLSLPQENRMSEHCSFFVSLHQLIVSASLITCGTRAEGSVCATYHSYWWDFRFSNFTLSITQVISQ